MSKFNIFVIPFVMVAVGLIFYFKNIPEKPELLINTIGYMDYSASNLETAKIKGKPILFFAATRWCQTCSELEKEILSRVNEIPQNVTILKVDYDNDQAVNTKWGIASQHTLVLLDENGEEVTRWVGGDFNAIIDKI